MFFVCVGLSCLFLLFNSFLIHHIHTYIVSSPSTTPMPPLPSFSPRSTLPPFLIRNEKKKEKKRVGFPGILTEHGPTSYNKNRHKPGYQDQMRQLSRRKRVPSTGNEPETPSLSLLGVPQNVKLQNHSINAEDLA